MERWEGMSLKNPVTPPGINVGTVRLVAQCLNHYATPGPIFNMWHLHFTCGKHQPTLQIKCKEHFFGTTVPLCTSVRG